MPKGRRLLARNVGDPPGHSVMEYRALLENSVSTIPRRVCITLRARLVPTGMNMLAAIGIVRNVANVPAT